MKFAVWVGPGLALVGFCACSSEPKLPDDLVGCAGYEEPGPYVAGVRTLDLDGVPVEVWYPATPASAAGRSVSASKR